MVIESNQVITTLARGQIELVNLDGVQIVLDQIQMRTDEFIRITGVMTSIEVKLIHKVIQDRSNNATHDIEIRP
jgi:hypothetical protein